MGSGCLCPPGLEGTWTRRPLRGPTAGPETARPVGAWRCSLACSLPILWVLVICGPWGRAQEEPEGPPACPVMRKFLLLSTRIKHHKCYFPPPHPPTVFWTVLNPTLTPISEALSAVPARDCPPPHGRPPCGLKPMDEGRRVDLGEGDWIITITDD